VDAAQPINGGSTVDLDESIVDDDCAPHLPWRVQPDERIRVQFAWVRLGNIFQRTKDCWLDWMFLAIEIELGSASHFVVDVDDDGDCGADGGCQ